MEEEGLLRIMIAIDEKEGHTHPMKTGSQEAVLVGLVGRGQSLSLMLRWIGLNLQEAIELPQHRQDQVQPADGTVPPSGIGLACKWQSRVNTPPPYVTCSSGPGCNAWCQAKGSREEVGKPSAATTITTSAVRHQAILTT